MTDLTKFRELGLSEEMLAALNKKGFEEPSPIQAQAIPFLLKNEKDLIGRAQTGTGKTAAFGIPLLELMQPKAKNVQAIILAPTRELALQVTEELNSFAENKKARIIAVYGGQPIDRQITQLKRGVDIVVGTPGRVLDHLDRGTLNISQVSHIILDEADEMLNMGFIDDIETILKAAPKERRTVLFSATMPDHIQKLAKRYMSDYEVIAVNTKQASRDNIEQIYFEVTQSDKFEALFRIIDCAPEFYGMVFCRTKLDTDEVAHKLANRGLRAEAIHGDLSQAQREKVLKKFRDRKVTALIATDVAARGIDVDDLTHVVNFSLPQDPESYVHRIGRTGRAGKSGTAITLITPSEFRKLSMIQRIANTKIDKRKVPDVATVISSKRQRVKNAFLDVVNNGHFTDLEAIAEEILQENIEPKVALAAVLKLAFKDELNVENYSEIQDLSDRRQQRNDRPERGNRSGDRFGDNRGNRFNDRGSRFDDRRGNRDDRRGGYSDRGATRLFVAKGRNAGIDPRGLVNFIQNESGVSQSRINDVKIFDDFSFCTVAPEDANRILDAFRSKGGRSMVSKAKN
jgi:ATP-dependent RNA helicase DeaD